MDGEPARPSSLLRAVVSRYRAASDDESARSGRNHRCPIRLAAPCGMVGLSCGSRVLWMSRQSGQDWTIFACGVPVLYSQTAGACIAK
ncbi:hypothetical protein CCHR01_02661 [Colletotrichum chrysophilum]|uniref:Uncharacterized protein n=1 Tax=Colletotrichum chrysophilum TaxID=1836956 RepID=A0AAD9AZU5_9PEZI|nr:hypothetical protein CCHR01_02661 [Colletotrichum chrysophilum]